MTDARTKADELLQNATMAAAVFQQLDQTQTDHIVEKVFKAGFAQRIRLAKMAHEETGLGMWEHKVLKNVLATQMVYENIRDEKTVDVLSHDNLTGITEIAQPVGPILAITPVTNPTSTVLFKILISLKTRNPIIIAPHRNTIHCCAEAAKICYEAALEANAPEDCVQWITEPSRELTQALMTHPALALILATGGTSLVKAAYSSGTPALGVGPGNVPVFIEKTADISFAVENIILSKTFDNGTVCASEQAIVVERQIAEEVKKEFERQQCYFVPPEDVQKIERVAVDPGTGIMSLQIIGQPVKTVAEMAGISVPTGTRVLIVPLERVGKEYLLSGEILAPILAFYICDDFISALKTCIDLNYRGGIGHTVSIYSNNENVISEFAKLMNAGRIVVNTPSSQGAVGGLFNTLQTSFTLGCGTGGKNITTENIGIRHLINIKKVCRRRSNERWMHFQKEKYLDEALSIQDILREYNKNY